jgi:hypothetical protein
MRSPRRTAADSPKPTPTPPGVWGKLRRERRRREIREVVLI